MNKDRFEKILNALGYSVFNGRTTDFMVDTFELINHPEIEAMFESEVCNECKHDVTDIHKAIDTLKNHLDNDKEYYDTWKANLAMAFYDELITDKDNKSDLHKICNDGADRFLSNFIKYK